MGFKTLASKTLKRI